MIDRATGILRFNGGEVGPGLTPREAVAAGFEGAPGPCRREVEDPRGRALTVGLRFVDGRLAGLALTYAVRRPAEGLEGRIAWETARKDYQDAIVREWFAMTVHDLLYAPPPQPGPLVFRFPWGIVRSDGPRDAVGATIDVWYAGEAD